MLHAFQFVGAAPNAEKTKQVPLFLRVSGRSQIVQAGEDFRIQVGHRQNLRRITAGWPVIGLEVDVGPLKLRQAQNLSRIEGVDGHLYTVASPVKDVRAQTV